MVINNRIIGLDILRLFFAFCIFCFHSRIHLGCDYGILNYFFSKASFAMTGFFMLSGYSLWLSYKKKDLTDARNIKHFYIKRLISIYPLYYVIGMLVVIMLIIAGRQSAVDNLILLPIEVLGIQSFFNGSLFVYCHDSGTWFISCILICYLLFPLIHLLLNKADYKIVSLFCIFLIVLLSYSHSLSIWFECGDMYTNASFRVLEFILGVIVAKINSQSNETTLIHVLRSRMSLIITFLTLILGISLCNRYQVDGSWLIYVCLTVVFLGLGVKTISREEYNCNYIIYASSLMYSFYLCQFLVWNPTKLLQQNVGEFSNLTKIVGTFITTLVLSILTHEIIEKRIGSYLKQKLIYDRRDS